MLPREAAPNEPTRQDRAGPRMVGKYRLLRQVGVGGMGVVHEAEDTVLLRKVAVKMLPGKQDGPGGPTERFLREGRAAARISHPHVVPIYDVGQADGAAFLVMEYLPGGSVHQLLQRHGRLPHEQAISLIVQAGRGLAAAHAVGLVHRDVKPGNLLLAADGSVKVGDFGLVKVIDDSTLGVPSLSGPSRLMGTPHFMSPEQCKGEPLDERTDVYSLAVCLYVLLTGRLPYDAENVYAILYAHCSAAAPDPGTLVPGLPATVLEVLKRGMARQRGSRYASMNAFVLALEGILGVPTLEKPVSGLMRDYPPPPPLPRSPRRVTRRVVLLGLAGAALGAVGLGLWRLWPKRDDHVVEKSPDAAEVEAKLRQANPEWKGEFVVKRQGERVVGLDLTGNELTNLEPLAELRDLEELNYVGGGWDTQKLRSKLEDVRPLGRLSRLRRLTLKQAPVLDLRPLSSLPLVELSLEGCSVIDLGPVAGMPLRKLNVHSTRIQSLEPLARCTELEDLHAGTYGVTHLGDLRDLPLKRLSLSGTQVTDLRPIRKCPLVYLECYNTRLTSLADLEGTSIEELRCEKELIPTLPRLPKLKKVNDDPWPR